MKQRASGSPSTAEPTGNDAADNEDFLCNPRGDRTVWICLRHREPQFIFLGGVSFCQSSRVKLRETIRHEFTFGLNTWNFRWEMGVVGVQLCFSKAQGASRTHRLCPGGVTSAQKGILVSPPCSLGATARGDAPGTSAWKFLRSVHIPVLHISKARAGGFCLQEELWQ